MKKKTRKILSWVLYKKAPIFFVMMLGSALVLGLSTMDQMQLLMRIYVQLAGRKIKAILFNFLIKKWENGGIRWKKKM